MNSTVGALILSGGKSERMKQPKAFLKIGKKTFLEKIISEYLKINADKIVVVVNKNCFEKIEKTINEKIEFVENKFPEMGRFYSIKLGLNKMQKIDFCFLQNVDEPFVDKKTLRKIISEKNQHGYTTPVFKGKGGHPILISKNVISAVNNMKDFNCNLQVLLENFNRRKIKVENEKILININNQKDYKKYFGEKCFSKNN